MSFGGFAIDEELFAYIREILPIGETILELGSGDGTAELIKYYNVYSIENDEEWLGKYRSNYIHAPLKEHKIVRNLEGNIWYDPSVLKKELKDLCYDLILVDGPSRLKASRAGFVKYRSLFNLDVPIIFDDVNREGDWIIAVRIAGILKRPLTVHNTWKKKYFGVILP